MRHKGRPPLRRSSRKSFRDKPAADRTHGTDRLSVTKVQLQREENPPKENRACLEIGRRTHKRRARQPRQRSRPKSANSIFASLAFRRCQTEDPAIQPNSDRRETKSAKDFPSGFEAGTDQRQRCVFS